MKRRGGEERGKGLMCIVQAIFLANVPITVAQIPMILSLKRQPTREGGWNKAERPEARQLTYPLIETDGGPSHLAIIHHVNPT